MKKRILSLFLALGMLLSLLPSAALAVGRGTDSVPASSEVSAAPVEARSTAAVKGGGGGGLLWHSNFEDENSLFGWQIISANGDGSTFARVQDSYTSDWCLSSNESISKAYSQSPPDDYVITPRIDLPKSDCEYTLGVKGGVTSSGSLVGFALYVYTGTEMLRPDNLYTLLGQYYRFDVFCWSDWNWKYFDLSAYAGQTVQIVVRRFDDEMNNNALKLAELAISYQEPDEQLSKVTAFNVPLPELGVSAKTLKARESEITFPDYANYELVPGSLTYYKFVGEDSEEMHNQVFTEDGQYSLHFRVRPKAGVEVYEQGCASVNGNWAQFTYLSTTEEVSIAFWGMPALVPAKEVREVNLRVMAPVVGKDQDTTAERWLADGSTDYHYTVSEYDWDPPGSGVFESGVEYGIWDRIDLEEGYTMAENPHFTVNREPAVCLGSAETNEWYIIKSFPADCKEPIVSAALSLEKPRADQYPGWPSPYNPDFWVVSCNWYPVSAFGEVQRALSEGETLEPSTSYWVYFGLKADDNYSFTESTRVIINGTEAVFYQENDGVWYYCLPVKTRSKDPITVTFNAHGHGTAPAPIEIPYGSSLWDGYYNLNDLRIENTDGMFFWGWSEYTTDRKDDRLAWEQELYEDVTLYAIWLKEYDYVTLFVDQPIVLDPIEKPNVSTTSACYFMPEPLGWWSSADGYWQDEEPLTGTFQPGKTYYGVVRMEPELDAIFGESGDVVSVIGGRKVREDLVDGEDLNDSKILYVTFSVSVPRRGEIDEIDLFVDIGWSGWLMYGTPPTQLCTTPGVGLVEGSWWANLEDVGDESKAITGRFPTDCLIYTDLQAFPSLNCSISDNPTVNIVGGTLIRTEPGSSGSVHIIYSVYSPAYHGMEFRSQGSGWFLVDDDPHAHEWHEGPFFETGTHFVTAVPDPGWHFKGWYEGRDADVLVSTYPVYVFENEPSDEDLCLTVVFEEGVLSVDRVEIEVPIPFAGDSFDCETESAGAGVVNDAPVRITEDNWYNEWGLSGSPLPFEEGQNYFVEIDLTAEPGYEITDNTIFLINGEEVPWKQKSNVVTWTIASRNYTMQSPIPVGVVEIEVPIPAAGDSFYWSTDSSGAFVSNDAQVRISKDKWYTEGGISADPLVFELGKKYFVGLDLKDVYPYQITEDTDIRINGETVSWKQHSNVTTWSVSSVKFTIGETQEIPTLDIRFDHIPAVGETFDPDYDWVAASSTPSRIVWVGTTWRDAAMGTETSYPLTFVDGGQYYVSFVIGGASGWKMTDDTLVTINGEPVANYTKVGVGVYQVDSRNYTVKAPEPITELDLQLHHIPAAGETFDWNSDVVQASTMAQIDWRESYWIEAGCSAVNPLTFVDGGRYEAYFIIRGRDGFTLTDDTVATVDGEPAAAWDHLGGGWYGLTTPVYTVHREKVIPAIEVYANKPVYDIEPDEPYIPSYMSYSVEDWVWTDASGNQLPKDFTVVGGAEYTLTVMVKPDDGYMFSADELKVRLFWDDAEIVSVKPNRATIRATCKAGMGTPNPFVDVNKTDWFYESVMWAYYHDPQITKGTDDTHFSPKRNCSRSEVVTFLWRAAGCPEPTSTENPFTDVKTTDWYYNAVLWAVENNITSGTGGTTFSPKRECMRGEVVTFLWRAAGQPAPTSTETAFTDVEPTAFYYQAMLWAVEEGITTGTSSTTFAPKKNCTRSEVVTFLFRAFGPKG